MKWNPEQQEAIEFLGQDILVCASAGAGKTAVLVERLVKRCLVDRTPLDRIVAMTFTEAAASEMKQRLSLRLKQELDKGGADTEYIQSQLVLLQAAQISTIHSFCLSLIKKHIDTLGLDPAIPNNILNTSFCLQLKKKAFRQTLRNFIQTRYDDVRLLTQQFSARAESVESLETAVFKIINIASTSFNQSLWYEKAKQSYSKITNPVDLPQPLINLYWQKLERDITYQLDLSMQAHQSLLVESPSKEKAHANLLTRIQFLNDSLEKLHSGLLQETIHAFHLALSKKLDIVRNTTDYKNFKSTLTAHQKVCLETYATWDMTRQWHNQTSPIAQCLLDLAQETHQVYTSLKHQEAGLEFDDMEGYALAILQANNNHLSHFYQSFFEEVMVDEFQDTNEIQNEIIKAISNGKNAFRVGDVKQSIYRFRHAKPNLMRALIQDKNTHVISLSYNYRSNQSIVNFNNDFFSSVMNIDGCKDIYAKSDHVQAGTDRQKQTSHPVEFYALYNDSINESEDDEETIETKKIKATFIAQKIIEMKTSTSFTMWKDYVVLVKSHQDKQQLKQAFDKLNIPYSIHSKEGFYQSECAQIVTSFLHLVLDIKQDIYLAAVLSSSLYQMSDNHLATLVLDHGSLLEGCIKTNHALIQDLKNAQSILANDGISALLHFISSINDFYHVHLSIQQKTNFDLLSSKVFDFEKKSSNLNDFIQEVEISIDERDDEAISLGLHDDVVRVITIHHSKGLQFNVVFYWSLSKQVNLSKKDGMLVDSELGIALHNFIFPERYRFPSIHRVALDYKDDLEALEEDIRVLYVALTRAQHHLIVVDTLKELPKKEKLSLPFLQQRKGSTRLLLNASLDKAHFTLHETRELLDITAAPIARKKTQQFTDVYSFVVQKARDGLSPSQLAHQSTTLVLENNYGKDYGLHLHKLIEQLPNRMWTTTDLNGLDCSSSDKSKLLSFSNNPLYKKSLDMTILKEVPFHLVHQGNHHNGIMDFVAVGEYDIILIDFKTDANVSEEELKQRYTKQLELYRYALEKAYPSHHISSYLYSFALQKEIAL
ncbi:MAG: UvrD-helicase domain-containing protein [Anaerorhabdus sp.]